MNLELFFTPVEEAHICQKENTLGFYVDAFVESIPNWQDADLVLFTIPEFRGKGFDEIHSLDAVRTSFYELKNNFDSLKIADLGNLKPGPTLEDTYLRVQEVVCALLQQRKERKMKARDTKL